MPPGSADGVPGQPPAGPGSRRGERAGAARWGTSVRKTMRRKDRNSRSGLEFAFCGFAVYSKALFVKLPPSKHVIQNKHLRLPAVPKSRTLEENRMLVLAQKNLTVM